MRLLFFMLPASTVNAWSSRSRYTGRSDMEGQVQHLFTACSKGYGYGQTSVKACTTVNIESFSAH